MPVALRAPPFALLDPAGGFEIAQEWIAPWPGARGSATIHALERLWHVGRTWRRTRDRLEVTRRLLIEMDASVRRQGGRLIVAVLAHPLWPTPPPAVAGVTIVDCAIPFIPDLFAGGHPNGVAHGRFAACISDAIGKRDGD